MIPKILKYQSGEEIRKGDHVLFHGAPAEIEFVVTDITSDPSLAWYLDNEGLGVMIIEPKVFGRAYLAQPEKNGDLVFVSRAKVGA